MIFPTSPIVAPLASDQVSSIENFQALVRNTDPGSNIGLPGLSLPIGSSFKSNLPIALEIDGLPHTDSELLAIGATLEAIFKNLQTYLNWFIYLQRCKRDNDKWPKSERILRHLILERTRYTRK